MRTSHPPSLSLLYPSHTIQIFSVTCEALGLSAGRHLDEKAV